MDVEPGRCGRPFLARRLADPQLRARVELAERLGISLRRLDGWEPERTTEYEYDDAGRLARSVTTTEPEWDDEQEGWLLALAWIRSRTCPSCGLDVEVCGARQNDGRFQAEARRCHATAARARAAGQYRSDPYPESLLYSVTLPTAGPSPS